MVAIADGALDNWGWLGSLTPDFEMIDFRHACQRLAAVADCAFGSGRKRDEWLERYRGVLRNDPNGIGKVIDAIRFLHPKRPADDGIWRELGFFRRNRRRMHYREATAVGFHVGSGPMEAANRMLVTQRMKHSGQRWGRNGGHAVLSLRAQRESGRFDAAWRHVGDIWRQEWPPVNADNPPGAPTGTATRQDGRALASSRNPNVRLVPAA